MTTKLAWTVAALAAAALAACGKAQEAASQKAAEKMIESSLSKDGSAAKVDLGAGSMKVTATDAQGKTSTTEIGGAQVTEAEVGVPFYPGTKPVDGGSSKMSSPSGQVSMVALHSDDPADKVAAFYRDKLKAKSEGKQFMDMSGADGGATLMLSDDKTRESLQVMIGKAEKGTDIHITSSREAAK